MHAEDARTGKEGPAANTDRKAWRPDAREDFRRITGAWSRSNAAGFALLAAGFCCAGALEEGLKRLAELLFGRGIDGLNRYKPIEPHQFAQWAATIQNELDRVGSACSPELQDCVAETIQIMMAAANG